MSMTARAAVRDECIRCPAGLGWFADRSTLLIGGDAVHGQIDGLLKASPCLPIHTLALGLLYEITCITLLDKGSTTTLGTMATRWRAHAVIDSMSPADAQVVSNWHYEGPWRIYDFNGQIPDVVEDYCSIRDPTPGGDLIGFFCVGPDARVPGLGEVGGTLDLGWGMNPTWVGQGFGTSFGAMVIAEAQRRRRGTSRIRAVVQSWNRPSIRVLQELGFRSAGTHACVQQGQPVQYDVLLLDLATSI